MTHGPHTTPRRVLGDDCQECRSRANDLYGLSQLDDRNIAKLANLAVDMAAMTNLVRPQDIGASYADMIAVNTLRLAARIVFTSGITEKVAR